MKKFFLPLTTIVGCAGISFVLGSQVGIQRTNAFASQRPSTAKAETIVDQPGSDLESTCDQEDNEACEQTRVNKDLIEFQTRLQRIMDRAESEITQLKNESTRSWVEMNSSNSAQMDEEMQADAEVRAPSQTIQKDLLKQIVSSSLQPLASVGLRPVEFIERNFAGEQEVSGKPEQNSLDIELVDLGNVEIQSYLP